MKSECGYLSAENSEGENASCPRSPRFRQTDMCEAINHTGAYGSVYLLASQRSGEEKLNEVTNISVSS